MVAVPFLVESKVLVAVTVIVPASASAIIVTLPDWSTVAFVSSSTLHTTDLGAKSEVATVAVNCADCPGATVAVAGETVTLVTAGVPGINSALFANGEMLKVFHT